MITRLLLFAMLATDMFIPGRASLVGPSFLKEPPSRLEFSNDTGAVLDCMAAGSPSATLSWLSEGKVVADVPGALDVLANGSLHFLPFHAGGYRHDVHAATYRCQAANAAGKIISRDVRVHAVVLQDYVVQVYYNKNVVRGNTAVLKCTIPSFVREYITVTSWLQDESFNIYPSLKGDGKYHMLPSGELLIYNVEESDKYRSYQCRAVNRLTGSPLLSTTKARFTVTDGRVTIAPRPMEKVVSIHARKDRTVVLPCFSEGNPPPSVSWYRMDRQQLRPVQEDERLFSAGEVLVIQHAEDADAGHWVCVLNNTAGSERVDISLQLSSPLSVLLQPQGQVTVDVGSRAELRCSVSGGNVGHGAGVATRSWYKDGHLLAGQTHSILVLEHVQREDAGMYQCLARADDDDSAQATTQLILGAARPQLLYKFIRQTLSPGPHVSLKCIAAGNPTPHISWNLDGFPLPQNDRFVIGQYMTLHGDVISHVNISNVQVEDGGIYQCVATNRVGEARHAADMRVYGIPFVRPMPNVSAVAGEPLYIACPAAGYPIDAITWEKDGRALPMNRRQHVFPNGTLFLENVQRDSDRGQYRCSATNKQGRSSSQALDVSVIVPPKITPFAFQTDLHMGERAGVQCFVSKGDLPLALEWSKDGQPLSSDVEVRPQGEFVSSLSIESLRPDHAGTYVCVAANAAARVTHSSQLIVNVPPRWASEPRDQNVTRDQPVAFHCRADGFPQPHIIWRKVIGKHPSEFQDLTGRQRGLQTFPNGTLFIKQAVPEMQGQYLCEGSNGIGAGVSAVVNLKVHIPPEFEVKSAQVSVRRGAPQTLSCPVQGDGPMAVNWQKDMSHPPLHLNPRFEVKESEVKGGFLSELHISSTAKSDSGAFTCVATNPFGRAERVVHLQVQDAPGRPHDLRVLEATSRQIKLQWLAPQDDRSPALQYTVEVQQESEGGSGGYGEWQSSPVGSELRTTVGDLLPATRYRLRVVAENELGAGEPSDPVTAQTDGDIPAGEPQGLNVTPTASDTLSVSWAAPPKHLWHGDIIGYYVGYREHGLGRSGGYNFSTVLARANGAGMAVLSDLKKYRKYGIVVQAFNQKGPGPMSQEEVAQTLEDVPGAPPLDVSCESRAPQTLYLTWKPPPALQHNGVLLGYRVFYENLEEWPPGVIEAKTKVTSDSQTELYGLQSYSNYSVRVWAFTRVGDGVRSKPIYCFTDEDVPDAPANIKVVASSLTSLVVSWLPPQRPHGRLTAYTVYRRAMTESGQEHSSAEHRLPPSTTSYQIANLSKGVAYEFWATASTAVGEGHSTSTASAKLGSTVPAAIVSFGQRASIRRRGTVILPCVVVGIPAPKRTWMRTDGKALNGEGFSINSEGSLKITDAQRQHSANYTCTASNSNGSDQIMHIVQVQVPPGAPTVRVSSTAASWVQLQWSVSDTGGSAIRGYLLNFRREEGDWEERTLPSDASSYRLVGLDCGSQYQLQMMALNAVGSSPAASITARTDGGLPGKPSPQEFLEPNSSTVGLNLRAWSDNGCAITSFSVQYREKGHEEWLAVGTSVHSRDMFVLSGLWPGSTYVVRVSARSAAGVTQAEYEVTAMPLLGGTLSPDSAREEGPESADLIGQTMYLVYITSLSLVGGVATAMLVICLRRRAARRRHSLGSSSGPGAGEQTLVAMDNKHNLAQREQYYAALQKGMAAPGSGRDLHCNERIPEYAEDISPYATFHVASQHSQPSTFLYHEQRLAAMETLQLKSTNPRDREDCGKIRNSKGKSVRSESTAGSDYSGSTDQWSEITPCRPDRIPMQALLYGAGTQGGGPESSTSPEQSPVLERRTRHIPAKLRAERAAHHGRRLSSGHPESGRIPFGTRLDPPTGFSDGHELSEAECDMDTLHRIKSRAAKADRQRLTSATRAASNHFTIAV